MTFDREHWQYAALTNRGSGRIQRAVVGIHFHDDLYYRRFPQGNTSDYTYSRSLIEDRYYGKGQSDARYALINHGQHGGGGGDHQDSDHYDAFYTESESDLRYARLLHDHPYSPITHTHSNTASWFIHDHIHNHHYDDIDGHPDFYTQDQSNSRFARVDHDSEHDDRFARIEHDSSHDDRFARIEHDTAHDDRFARINHDSSHDDRYYTQTISDARFAPINHGEHGGSPSGDFSSVGHSHSVEIDPAELDYAEVAHDHPGFTDPSYWTTSTQFTVADGSIYPLRRHIGQLPGHNLSLEATAIRTNRLVIRDLINYAGTDFTRVADLSGYTDAGTRLGTADLRFRALHSRDVNVDNLQVLDFTLSNVAPLVHVHDDDGGVLPPHNHDLRYYTEPESDARFLRQSFYHVGTESSVTELTATVYARFRDLRPRQGGVLNYHGDAIFGDEITAHRRIITDTLEANTINVYQGSQLTITGDLIMGTLLPVSDREALGTRARPWWSIVGVGVEFNTVEVDILTVQNFVHSNVASSSHSHSGPGETPEEHTHNEYLTEPQGDIRYSNINHSHLVTIHTHDDRYYTEAQADSRYAERSHDHGTGGAHQHDDRYYTQVQVTAGFSDVNHNHNSLYSRIDHEHDGAGPGGDSYWTTDSAAEAEANRIYALSTYAHAPRFIAAERIESPILQTRAISSDLTAGIDISTHLIPFSSGSNNAWIGSNSRVFRKGIFRDFDISGLLDVSRIQVFDFDDSNVASNAHTHPDVGGAPEEHSHDNRYYTEDESNARFSLVGHMHEGGTNGGTPTAHFHDDLYYRRGYIELNFAPTIHPHPHTHNTTYYTKDESDARFAEDSHSHQGVGGTPISYGTPVSIGSFNSQGSGDAVARALHIHAHPSGMHERGGAVEIDGDRLDIDYTPGNYSRSTSPSQVSNAQHLTAHLHGIDNALANTNGGNGGLSEEEVRDLIGRMVTQGLKIGINVEHDDPNDEFDFVVQASWVRDVVGDMVFNNIEENINVYYQSGKLNFAVAATGNGETPIVPWTAVPSNIVPLTPLNFSLGTAAYPWDSMYLSHLHVGEISQRSPHTSDHVFINAGLDLNGHLDMSDHVVYGIGSIERAGDDSIALPSTLGGLSSLSGLRTNWPHGGLLVGEDGATFTSTLDSVLNAFFQDIPGIVSNFLSGDDHGRIFIRVGSNVYVFHSDSKISLTGV